MKKKRVPKLPYKTHKETVLKIPYFGFDHEAVAKKFRGGLTFLNEFCVKGEYLPSAVYRAANPDVSKGHKRYMLLQVDRKRDVMAVRGMTEEEMEKERFQDAVLCNKCNRIIFSMNRHDMHHCLCKKGWVAVDGGKDYLRIAFDKEADYLTGRLDLLTDQFTAARKEPASGAV